MKILLLDLESAPNTAHVWGLWGQDVHISQLLVTGYVMCWAAKWYGGREMYFDSIHKSNKKKMLRGVHTLLDQADAVVHYNGSRFDIPTLNKEFIECGMRPPAPYAQIDLLKTARRQFRFPSNKLDFISQHLGLGSKTKHKGHQLWIDCMAGKEDAWRMMERYNKQDVRLLEKVYIRMLPWISDHPNHGAFDQLQVCTNCGSSHYQHRGYATTKQHRYPRYQCLDCGSWFRGTKTEFRQRIERFTKVAA